MATFVAGFIVGFTSEWRIALVTIAVVPLIAISGGFYAYHLTSATSRASGAYAEAGSIAEQVRYPPLCNAEFQWPAYWVPRTCLER